MTIQTNKVLGGVGACLTLLGVISAVLSLVRYAFPNFATANLAFFSVSSVVGLLAFVGFIFFFIAMYGFSKDYGEHKIFDYILYGLIITIVAAVIAVIILFIFVLANLTSIVPNLDSEPSSPQIASLMSSITAPLLAVSGFFTLINVVFNVLALNLLAVKSGVHLFRTSAKVFFVGAIVQIVAGIVFAIIVALSGLGSLNTLTLVSVPGGLVQYVAWALLAVSFFRITALPTQTSVASNEYRAVTGQVKYCPFCGAQNSTDAVFCVRCGKKQ